MRALASFFGFVFCMAILGGFWIGGGILIVVYSDWIEAIGALAIVGGIGWVIVEPVVYRWRWKRKQRALLQGKS